MIAPGPVRHRLWIVIALLVAAFALSLYHIQRESLWNDEAWTAWAVLSPYVADTVGRVRADVHPPLYFLLLDGWTLAAGESALALRVFSALCGLIGLAVVYRLGRRLFDPAIGRLALITLATSTFYVYYSQEARMYTLLLALSAAGTWVYLRWRARPSRRLTLLYALLLAALAYTHYAGALIGLTQLLHSLLTGQRPRRLTGPALLALILYSPWLPVFFEQMRGHPNGPLAMPVATDGAALASFVAYLTGGAAGWLVALALVSGAFWQVRRYRGAILLLALWLLLTPVALLALNAWAVPVFQVRYTLGVLPALALLIAFGLRHVVAPGGLTHRLVSGLPRPAAAGATAALAAALLSGIIFTQFNAWGGLWPERPRWEAALRAIIAARQPLEATITDLAPYSPPGYYSRYLPVRQGIGLDLSWRLHTTQEVRALVALFDRTASVWVILPTNTAKSWQIVAALDAERGAGYRDSVWNMIFYRFDTDRAGDLAFRFGDALRFEAGPEASQILTVRPGESLCPDIRLRALTPLDERYSAGLHLVNASGDASLAQWDGGVGALGAGATVTLSGCLEIPLGILPGQYSLQLSVYTWWDGARLPVVEDGAGDGLGWGDVLRLAAVDIAG